MRALLVDDSSTMRAVLRLALRGAGFETFEAANGIEALKRLREIGPVDLALVDWNMPEMNGYELLREVRSHQAYNDVRVVMVTTETEISHVQSALSEGANEYLMKPFTREAVLEKLQILGLVPQAV